MFKSKSNLKRLWPYIKMHKAGFVLAMFFTAFAAVLDVSNAVLLKNLLSPLLDSGGGDPILEGAAKAAPHVAGAGGERLSQLNFWVVVILGIGLLRVVVSFLQAYMTQRTGQRVLFRLREDLFRHFQTLSISFFESRRTGEIMSRLTNDISALQSILTSAVTTVAGAPLTLVGMLFIMVWYNWKLSLFVVVILPPAAFLINKAGSRIRENIKRLQQQNATLTNYLQEKISAMRLIQTFGTQSYENALFKKTNDASYRATMKPIRVQASLAPVIEFTGMCGVVFSLWVGGRDVVAGNMDASALAAFVLAVHRAAMQAKSIANLNLTLRSAEAASSRLWEMMDTQPEVKDSTGALTLAKSEVQGHVRFENVHFAYEEGKEVLHNVSFEIKPGEVVALAGLSGGGKSTIANLLPRLYDPTQGRITLDGRDLRDITLQSLRDLIGAVPQDVTLFHGTVRSNITYGTPDAPQDTIVAAARRAHADEFVRRLPEAYDSPVGERGTKFSGGQKQRLAIARALLRDPKLLILDEATSALDAESEGLVQDALAELMKGRTTLIIAHRFSTIIHADKILVLDQGQIVESGTHQQLLAQKGQYWKLYQMQAFQARRGENEADDTENAETAKEDVRGAWPATA